MIRIIDDIFIRWLSRSAARCRIYFLFSPIACPDRRVGDTWIRA